MLSNLKEKLLHVNLFSSSEEKPSDANEVNINAGGEILQHYQKIWEEIHKANVDNATEADRIGEEIDVLSNKVNLHKENLELLTHIISNSNLVSNITSCLNSINELYSKTDSIESDLIKLESVIDQIGFEKLKKRHCFHLNQYELRKQESLEKFRKNLDEDHSKKVTEYEASKKVIQQERQKVFQDAFKSDLEMYKITGTIPEISRPSQNSALLEEIQIDYDQNELDQFFNENH